MNLNGSLKERHEEGLLSMRKSYDFRKSVKNPYARQLIVAFEAYMNTDEMRAILKEKNPLIGTPGGMIKGYRARESLTQQQLAKKAGLKQGHLSAMERNKRPVGVKVAKRLAKALRCDYRRFL